MAVEILVAGLAVLVVWAGLVWLRDRVKPWPHLWLLAVLLSVACAGPVQPPVIVRPPEPPVVVPPVPDPPHAWETATEADLRRWCGAIATVLWNDQSGIRPGRSDNALFTAEYINPVYDAAGRARMRTAYPYTHWSLNPIVAKGYHGYWPDTDWRGNIAEYQARVDELWGAGFVPVPFLLDDTGVYTDGRTVNREAIERDLTPLYSQPWFQERFRVVVNGWEHNYASDDWQWVVQWMARVFPNALRYIHFESGHGAPGLGSELAPNGPYATEGSMWVPVVGYIHGFLQQDTYAFLGDSVDDGRTPEEQVLYDAMDFIRRFRDGYAGWPTNSATPGRGVDMVMFEYGSYALFHGGPGRFGTFANAASASYEMGRQLLQVPGIAGIGDGGPCMAGR